MKVGGDVVDQSRSIDGVGHGLGGEEWSNLGNLT